MSRVKVTSSMTMDCTVVRSRCVTASSSMEPNPGRTKTFSITTAPMTSVVSCTPATVSTGSAALRSPWRTSASRGDWPSARAVRMKSWLITSRTAERT